VSPFEPTPPALDEPEGPPTFEDIYDATVGPVQLWLFLLGISNREREDAIQEIYLEAWRVWDTYDPAIAKRAQWLHGITVNVAARCRERRRLKAKREEPQRDDCDAASAALDSEEYVEINDRLRFTARLFEPISTLPLAIMIAYDMNNEQMKDIARRHGISRSEAYRLRDQAKHAFAEGYDREQVRRRKSGALILPFGALSLLNGSHEIPEVSPDLKKDLWRRIAKEIGNGGGPAGPSAPSHDPPMRPRAPAASVPPAPLTPPARPDGGAVVRAIRAALTAHPLAWPAALVAGGALAALAGERLLDSLDKNARPPIAQEARAVSNAGAPPAPVDTAPAPSAAAALVTAAADSSAAPRVDTGSPGQLTAAESAQFDVVRAAVKDPDSTVALNAIQGYLKVYPRGYFVGHCEKMRIGVLIRAGRLAEARAAVDRIRKRSPKSPLVKELESMLPGP
jgi:DNA-directed RNA polymerase specialized sigma24 family protein